MNKGLRGLVVVLILSGALSATAPYPAQAAGTVGDGSAGSCTEAALETALIGGGPVTFNCGVAPHTILLSDEKVIADNTQLDGGGLITLDGQDQDRIFSVTNDATLELSNLTLTRGNKTGVAFPNFGGAVYVISGALTIINSTLSNNVATSNGGAIYNSSGATLTIINSTLSNNTGGLGGAIHNNNNASASITGSTLDGNVAASSGGAIANFGGATLTITASAITNNSGTNPSFDGGGIYNPGGTIALTGSTVSGNVAASNGGAIRSSNGTLTIIDSALNNNQATNVTAHGGAIYSFNDTITLTNSTVNGNLANDDGGGIYSTSGSSVTITASTVNGNQSGDSGGGIHLFNGSSLTVTGSTISNNTLFSFPNDDIEDGGGLHISSSTATLTNSTVSGNTAKQGGGIYNFGTLTVTNSTVSDNAFVADDGGPGSGGGMYNVGTATLQNTIVANSGAPSGPGDNCFVNNGSITSQGGNLSDDDTCPLNQPSDLPDTEDGLGPLADNGGPTLTHLPASGSAAIDNALAANCPAEDQRGISRPQGSGCDIGAVERVQGATYLLCANYYTGAVTSPLHGGCGIGKVELTVPGNLHFCINPWTNELTYPFGRPCTPPRFAHTLPDDGDLLTCVNLYTYVNRWVWSHSQCSASEVANTIPAKP